MEPAIVCCPWSPVATAIPAWQVGILLFVWVFELGHEWLGHIPSPITGTVGICEFLAWLDRSCPKDTLTDCGAEIPGPWCL